MRLLMITQKVNLEDDILGLTHNWMDELAREEVWEETPTRCMNLCH